MITIISPQAFKTIPWKNGKGETTELAINSGGTLEHFDWRLSIAKVIEDGPFSDFSGYLRHLVLIKGNGISLIHDQTKADHLSSLLDMAVFNGRCKTVGKLISGEITDFNIMTRVDKYQVSVETYVEKQTVSLKPSSYCFLYCLEGSIEFSTDKSLSNQSSLKAGHLAKISSLEKDNWLAMGKSMMIIYLNENT